MKMKEPILRLRDALNESYEKTVLRSYYGLFGHAVDSRFAIVGNARTGSNFLLDGLKTSTHIKVYHEIFADHHREKGKDFEGTLSVLYQKQDQSITAVGFKLFYNHLTDAEWLKFQSHKDFKIIHLTRQNRLRTLVSLDIAFKTGQWTKSKNSVAARAVDKRIALDPSTLLQRLTKLEADETLARERFQDRPVCEVVYEDLVSRPMQVFHEIGEYLGVSDIDPAQIKLTRQNPESLERIILNFEDVRRALSNSSYSEYLAN
jgi:LPS sulfotransferase NodH